jgi:hypothetical protein
MKVNSQVEEVKTKKIVEIEETTKVNQVVITVDQDFVNLINAIGNTSSADIKGMQKGMSQAQVNSFANLYHAVAHTFREMKLGRTDNGDFKLN